ncbi:hypothetical protein [Microbulbifer sp.]|uniref:hypothetical protein n=1 Tax=Microbulbifer sp. TaxID=1908541 RepID=UPI003F3E0DA6
MTELNADSFASARSMSRELGDAIRGTEADYTRIDAPRGIPARGSKLTLNDVSKLHSKKQLH